MVDIDRSADARKTRAIMSANPDIRAPSASSSAPSPLRSPRRLASPKSSARAAAVAAPSAADVAAYELYLRLPELSALWVDGFPEWRDEQVLRPALQALEITFRFASLVLSDHRPHTDRRLWARRVEGLAAAQIQIIADLVAGDDQEEREELAEQEGGSSRSSSSASLSTSIHGGNSSGNARLRGAPVCEIRPGSMPSSPTSSASNLAAATAFPVSKARSSEVWKLPGEAPVVSRTSEESLLPLLATWAPSKPLASRILHEIEAQFKGGRCPFTLGVGEPNLEGKPVLRYDQVCRPAALHALKLAKGGVHGETSQAVFTAHQVVECWAQVARQLLRRIGESVAASADGSSDGAFSAAASDCWALERVWKLLAEAEDLHLLLDPDEFLRLKARLALSGAGLCFRSKGLAEAARESRELRRHVPAVLGVEADPTGGPALQDAAMNLFRRRAHGGAADATAGRVHLLQAFQAVDAAVKKFFFAYRQVVVTVMGSLEVEAEAGDPLAQMFMEPPCCPSIDAAKTFLGDHYSRRQRQQMQTRGPAPAAAGEKSARPALTHF